MKNSELDVIGAIESHLRWKIRLEAYINGTGAERLDADAVGRDDQCALGMWIYGPGVAHFGQVDPFTELKSAHAQFHQCAAAVIRTADAGKKDEAMRMLGDGDYAKCSYRVKMLLARVCREKGP